MPGSNSSNHAVSPKSKPIERSELNESPGIESKPSTPGYSERSGSSYSTNTASVASPIPNYNSVFIRREAGSTTPDSEVELSLAYKGTRKYGKTKRLRKFKKKKNQKSKNSFAGGREHSVMEGNDLSQLGRSSLSVDSQSGSHSIKTIDRVRSLSADSSIMMNHDLNGIERSSHSYVSNLQTLVAEENPGVVILHINDNSDHSENEICNAELPEATRSRLMKGNEEDENTVETFTVKSRYVQTEKRWFEDESLFLNIDRMPAEDMRELLFRLRDGIYGAKQQDSLPQIYFEAACDPSSSEHDVLEGSSMLGDIPIEGNDNFRVKSKVSVFFEDQLEASDGDQVFPMIARRIHSAHCIGKRKESEISENNIFELIKTMKSGVTSNNQPEILKYVGEKPVIKASQYGLDYNSEDLMAMNFMKEWYDGHCQFCEKQIIHIPTLEEIQSDSADVVYCCAEFKYFITLHAMNEENENILDEVIDVNPNAPFGSRKNRKAARERMADRQRERELERQKAAAQQANLFSFARQMKTIQYSLASSKYMDDGWSIKPTSTPPPEAVIEDDMFEVEVNSTLLQSGGVLVQKFYENGSRFLTIFPDGTGCCYYPSGNPAVLIVSTQKGKYGYIVQTNERFQDLEDSGLMAIFEPNGNSVCYFPKKQRIRLFINAHGGIELNEKGQKKKRWQWYFIKGHVHTPPFHPIRFSLNKFISVRVFDQNNIALIFASSKQSVRFNVGANLKAMNMRGQFEADESEVVLLKKKKDICGILRRIREAVRLPKSSINGTFPTTSQRRRQLLQKAETTKILPPIENNRSVIIK